MSFRLSTGLIATILVLVHCSRLNAQGYQPLAGDFNRDGIWDIGLREPPTGMFYLRLGDGKGNFTEIGSHGWTADTKGGPYQPFAGDFNRDGIWDIGLRQPSTGTFYFRLGDGKGNFTEIGSHPGTSDSQGGIYRPFAGDFDKDGFGDIGVFEARTGKLHIKLGDGRGNFSHWAVNQWTEDSKGGPYEPFAGDFNRDGIWDIGLRQPSTGTFYFRLGDGKGNFTEIGSQPWTSFSQGGIYRPFAGDFNKDGFADIGVFEARTGKLHIKLRDGRGNFSHWAVNQWTDDSKGGGNELTIRRSNGFLPSPVRWMIESPLDPGGPVRKELAKRHSDVLRVDPKAAQVLINPPVAHPVQVSEGTRNNSCGRSRLSQSSCRVGHGGRQR